MAIGTPVLLASREFGGATVTSPSFTPTAGRLLIVIGGARRGAANASAAFTISSSPSITFTLATELNAENGTSGPSARQAVWTATVPASPAATTVTVESVNASHITVVVIEIPSARWRSPNAGSGASNLGDPAPTLPSSINGMGLFAATFAGNPTPTLAPGSTEIVNVTGTNSRVVVRYIAGSSGTSGAWTTDGTRAVAAILGIEEAAATAAIDFDPSLDMTFARTVTATRGVSESCALDLSFSASSSRNATPERPASTWQGATRTWRMPEGTEPVAGSDLTFGTVTVTPPTGGFSHVADVNMYQWSTTAPSVTNFLMPVYINWPSMRSTANGGRVQNSSGWDIRFETSGGTKVPHKLLTYDPVLGRCVAMVNTPRNLGANQVLKCFIGKAGLTASEEDPAGLAGGGWLAIYAASGTEITGSTGRNLTAFGSPGTTAGISFYPALSFNGTNQYLQSSGAATWLNGLSQITVVSFHQPDTLERKSEVFNIANGANTDLSLHFNDATTDRLTFVARFGSSTYQYQSANDTQGPVYDGQAVAVAAQAGQAVRMAINGETDTPGSGVSIPASSTLNVSNFLEWGRGGRGDLAYWSGELAFLAFCNVAQPAAVLEAMTAAWTMGGPGYVEDFVAVP